jgi:DNA polymerase-3 subunit beta
MFSDGSFVFVRKNAKDNKTHRAVLVDENKPFCGVSSQIATMIQEQAFDDVVLTSKLIDGSFPDYQRVIPTGNDKILEVDRKEFHDAVDRVSTISSEKSRAVKLSLKPGSLTLSATSAENGSAVEEIEVKYDGAPVDIGFNSKYLLDVAQQIEGEGLQMVLADSVAPTLLRDMADAMALYVLMPMRV